MRKMKNAVNLLAFAIFSFASGASHSQAVDSAGSELLFGRGTRVDQLLPDAVPGPAGPAGPAGAPGPAGGATTGSMCGMASQMIVENQSAGAPVTSTYCQGSRIKYMSGRLTLDECPAGYAAGLLTSTRWQNSTGEGNSWNYYTTYFYTCFKT